MEGVAALEALDHAGALEVLVADHARAVHALFLLEFVRVDAIDDMLALFGVDLIGLRFVVDLVFFLIILIRVGFLLVHARLAAQIQVEVEGLGEAGERG